jgi:Jacalin-like lectin domain
VPAPKLPREQQKSADNPDANSLPAEEYGEECGGSGGVPYCVFAYYPDRIARVTIWHRQYVDGILLETDHGVLPKIGGTGRHRDIRSDTFALEPGEFITGISVEYWNYIDRINFHSNKGSYGPYGGSGARLKKILQAPAGRIVAGFKGRHWEFIDSIQLMVVPEPKAES